MSEYQYYEYPHMPLSERVSPVGGHAARVAAGREAPA